MSNVTTACSLSLSCRGSTTCAPILDSMNWCGASRRRLGTIRRRNETASDAAPGLCVGLQRSSVGASENLKAPTVEHRFPCYPLFERDPNLNNLRDDPDFKTWLAEMKSLWERRRASL